MPGNGHDEGYTALMILQVLLCDIQDISDEFAIFFGEVGRMKLDK